MLYKHRKVYHALLCTLTLFYLMASFILPTKASGTGAYNASDELGQYAGTPVYTGSYTTSNLGSSDQSFANPESLAEDTANHRLFFSDSENNRILVFNLDDIGNARGTADYVLGQPGFSAANFGSGINQLHNPQGLAIGFDPANPSTPLLFVADRNNGRIMVFDISTGTLSANACGNSGCDNSGQGENSLYQLAMENSYGQGTSVIAFDPVNDTFFAQGSSIFGWNLSGGITSNNVLNRIPDFAMFANSGGLAMDTVHSILYSADRTNHKVYVYDVRPTGSSSADVCGNSTPTTGLLAFVPSHSETVTPSSCTFAAGLSVGLNGNNAWFSQTNTLLYISDVSKNRVVAYNLSGGPAAGMNPSYVWGQKDFTSTSANALSGTTNQSGLSAPSGVIADDASNRLYVADYNNYRIMAFDISSGGLSAANGTHNLAPNAIDVFGQYVISGYTFDTTPQWTQMSPDSGALDSSLQPFINAAGFSDSGSATVALDSDHHKLFVGDAYRILGFPLDSQNNLTSHTADTVLGQSDFVTNGDLGISPSNFENAFEMKYDSSTRYLYMNDSGASRVLVYDFSSGIPSPPISASYVLGQPDFSSIGSQDNQQGFNDLWRFAIDTEDQLIFMTDTNNFRVLVFDARPHGSAPRTLCGVTTTGIDTNMNASCVIGQHDFNSKVAGSGLDQFENLRGLAYDSARHYLFVDDESNPNNRIAVFNVSIANLNAHPADMSASFTTTILPSENPELETEYDSANQLLYNVTQNNSVNIYDAHNPSAITRVGVIGQASFSDTDTGTDINRLSGPYGLSFDQPNNRLYVADTTNNRTIIFDLPTLAPASVPSTGTISVVYGPSPNLASSLAIPSANQSQNGATTFELAPTSDALPAGLSLDSATGIISGTPTTAGASNLIIRAKYSGDWGAVYSNTQSYTITIPDTISPTVSMTAPANSATISGSSAVLTATATDNVGVTKVEFYHGATLIGTDSTGSGSTYSVNWDTTSVTDGPYTLTAKAYDAANNTKTSSPITVTVQNTQNTNTDTGSHGTEHGTIPVSTSTPPPPSDCHTTGTCPTDAGNSGVSSSSSGSNGNSTSGSSGSPANSAGNTNSGGSNSSGIGETMPVYSTASTKGTAFSSSTINPSLVISSFIQSNIAKSVALAALLVGAVTSIAGIMFATPLTPSELVLLPTRLWSLLLGAAQLRKKRKNWGVIYDSKTKRPLDPVHVELIDQDEKVVAAAFTDLNGRYGFLVPPGHFMIRPKKQNYIFPSIALGHVVRDEAYEDLYFGNYFSVSKEGEVIAKNIPMDPVGFDWNEFEKNQEHLTALSSKTALFASHLADILFAVGFTLALSAFIFAPHPYNVAILGFYILLLIAKEVGISFSKLGTIIDRKTGRPLAYAIIRVFSASLGNEVIHKVATARGKFYLLVPNGAYTVAIEKKTHLGNYREVFRSSKPKIVKHGILKGVWEV